MDLFKPMLATNIKITDLRLPVYASLKLEGVRGEFTPVGLYTRPMKQFGNKWVAAHFVELVEYCKERGIYVEGEFYRHGIPFNELSSITRRRQHPDTAKLQLHIFDVYNPDDPGLPFRDRSYDIDRVVKEAGCPNVYATDQRLMTDHDSIQKFYENAIEDGYEGLCFKHPNEKYKMGRSTKNEQKFLRIKAEDTYDGIVLEIVERLENLVESKPNELGFMSKAQDKDQKAHTGMAAVAITKVKGISTPVRVTLSRGLSDFDREDIWEDRESYVGNHIRFVGIPVPGMEKPRAPRFDAWRTDLD